MDRHAARRDAGDHRGTASRAAGASLPDRAPPAPDARRAGRRAAARTPTWSRSIRRELRTKIYYRRRSGTRSMNASSRPREGHRRVYEPRREEVVEVLERPGHAARRSTSSSVARDAIAACVGCARPGISPHDAGPRPTTSGTGPRPAPHGSTRRTSSPWGSTTSSTGSRPASPPTTRACCRSSRRRSRSCSRPGSVKVVFATETLSLGINMPAKTVVIEDLWKFQGERHELLTPGEYTQLTGRAGRRGHRPGRPRGGGVPAAGRRSSAWRPWPSAHLRPGLVVPPFVQHGGQPGPQLHARNRRITC